MALLSQMQGEGIAADGVTYNMLLELVAEAFLHGNARASDAMRILLLMRKAGVDVDVTTWASLRRVWMRGPDCSMRPPDCSEMMRVRVHDCSSAAALEGAAAPPGTGCWAAGSAGEGANGAGDGGVKESDADREAEGIEADAAAVMEKLMELLHREALLGRAGPRDTWLLLNEMGARRLIPSILCVEQGMQVSIPPKAREREEEERKRKRKRKNREDAR